MRLSDEMTVCVWIYGCNQKGEIVWFGRLAEALEGSVPPAAISRCLDYLSDKGMLEANWERDPETGRWVRSLRIADGFEGFIEGLTMAIEQGWDGISDDLAVAVRIYGYGLRDDPVWFTKLAKDFEEDGRMPRDAVSRCLDVLFSLGVVEGDWASIDGEWIRTFRISKGALPLIEKVADGRS